MDSIWMDTREGARYVGFKTRTAWRTINYWIRKGLVPSQYVGRRGRDLVVQAPGLDAALRTIQATRRPRR